MKKLLELRQQKAALKTQMRSMLDKADTEKRSLNDEEGKQFDELRAQIRRECISGHWWKRWIYGPARYKARSY